MDIIRTGLGLTKTIKNVARFREIVSVFAKNGFDELLGKSGVLKLLPNFILPKNKVEELKESTDYGRVIGHRIKICFEELGPSFIKLGQLISSREDMFPASFIAEVKKLQDDVKPIEFEEVKKILTNAYKGSYEHIFSSIDEKPIGTASIGVVHKGVLKSGEEVVIKVRRPNIRQIIETDFEIFNFLIERIEQVSNDVKALGIGRILKDFRVAIENELDFFVEAHNSKRFLGVIKKFEAEDKFYLPKIYSEHVTEDTLVMELLKGTPFSDVKGIEPYKKEVHGMLEKGLGIFLRSILEEGFFHGDLHGGNFFYLPDKKKIGIIDFGLMGSMSKKSRTHFVAIIYSLLNNNFENLIYEFLDVAEYDKVPDVDALIRDAKDNISPFLGLTAQAINSQLLFTAIVKTLTAHRVYLPRDWIIVFRALIALDGVGRSLELDFDIFGIVQDDMEEILKSYISKDSLIEESVWVGRDVMNSLRIFPRQAKWFLKDFSRNDYTFQVKTKGYEKELERLSNSLVFLGVNFICGILIYSGSRFISEPNVLSMESIPQMTWVLWIVAFLLFFRGLIHVRK